MMTSLFGFINKKVVQKVALIVLIFVSVSCAKDNSKKKASSPPPPPPPPPTVSPSVGLNAVITLPSIFSVEREINTNELNAILRSVAPMRAAQIQPGLTNVVQQYAEQHLIDGAFVQSSEIQYEIKVQKIEKKKVHLTKTASKSLFQSPYGNGAFVDPTPVSATYRFEELKEAMTTKDLESMPGVVPTSNMWSSQAGNNVQFRMQNCWAGVQTPQGQNVPPQGPSNNDFLVKYYTGHYQALGTPTSTTPSGPSSVVFALVHKHSEQTYTCYQQTANLNTPIPSGTPTPSQKQLRIATDEIEIFVPKAQILGMADTDQDQSYWPQFHSVSVKIIGGPSLLTNSVYIQSSVGL